MKKSASLIAGMALMLAVAGCNGYDKTAYSATLKQALEVPPSGAPETGTFNLTFNGPVAEWTLTIGGAGLTNVTAAHIHQGAVGVAGAVYVFLYDGPTATITSLKGSFIAETITACTGTCFATRSYADLQAQVAAKTAYVNVHTVALAGGAIRGNF